MFGSGREALTEGQKALLDGQVWSAGFPEGPGVVGRHSQRV